LNERHLKRILTSYFNYYHHWRTHLSLGMDSPESRLVQSPDLGKIVHNQKSVAYITITNGWQHDRCDMSFRVVCNPRGYAPEALNPDFSPDWVVGI
jgi:hypothetical protein